MEDRGSKTNKLEFLSKIGACFKWSFKRVFWFGLLGTVLWYGGSWFIEWWQEDDREEEALAEYVREHQMTDVGTLLFLDEKEEGTNFNTILKLQQEDAASYWVIMTIRTKESFATFRTGNRVALDDLVLCDSISPEPVVRMKSDIYPEYVYNKESPGNDIVTYIQSKFGYCARGFSQENAAWSDRLYVYIQRDMCQHYIMLKKKEEGS